MGVGTPYTIVPKLAALIKIFCITGESSIQMNIGGCRLSANAAFRKLASLPEQQLPSASSSPMAGTYRGGAGIELDWIHFTQFVSYKRSLAVIIMWTKIGVEGACWVINYKDGVWYSSSAFTATRKA